MLASCSSQGHPFLLHELLGTAMLAMGISMAGHPLLLWIESRRFYQQFLPFTMSPMKNNLLLVASSLLGTAYGHGYLTIPSSRTRLGFEVRHTFNCCTGDKTLY
jgi:hypothetical protein